MKRAWSAARKAGAQRDNPLARVLVTVSSYLLFVLATLGEGIVETRNPFLWAFLFVSGFLYLPFGMFVSSTLLSYVYVSAATDSTEHRARGRRAKESVWFLIPALILAVASFSLGWLNVLRVDAVVAFLILSAILLLARYGGRLETMF